MTELFAAALHGMAWGIPAAAVLVIILLGAAMIEPETMLRGYPPDIREAYGAPGHRARRIGMFAAILAATGIVLSVAGMATTLGDLAFGPVFVALASLFAVVQVVDLVILDWLVFVTLRPSFVVLPGTAGMAGYGDLAFHVRGFAKAMVGSLVVAAAISLAITLIAGA